MWPRLTALIAVVALFAAACSSPSTAPTPEERDSATASTGSVTTVVPPDTAAGDQLEWLIGALAHLPISDADLRAHFNPGYLATATPAALNQWFEAVNEWLQAQTGVNLVSIKVDQPSMVVAIVSNGGAGPRARVGLTVDSRGLIGDLAISPTITGPVPSTWADVDATYRSVAPEVRLLVANVSNGSCQPVHSIDPNDSAPFGSVLKLYVLYALGEALAAGKVSWDQSLTVTAKLKSVPSGVLQNEPDGTQITVLDAATKMITISDNTSTDMLINLVGRSAVEKALSTAGMSNPALNRPFLTTRETFILTLEQWPTLAKRYLAASEAGRRALLANTVDRLPLPDAAAMRELGNRGAVKGLGWFASASDICRAYASLAELSHRPALSQIGQVLSINDDILELDPAQWHTTWRKGVVGPKALGLAYLATSQTGQSYVVAVFVENRSKLIDGNTAGPVIFSATKGAFMLAARR
ncbi:MAG TPA: serine hydrolase [Propionibacteriaceae bacterium]